jgi:hypothetical protein
MQPKCVSLSVFPSKVTFQRMDTQELIQSSTSPVITFEAIADILVRCTFFACTVIPLTSFEQWVQAECPTDGLIVVVFRVCLVC